MKPSKKQLQIIKESWKKMKEYEQTFYDLVEGIEKDMCYRTKIKGIEFVTDGGGYFGVGTSDKKLDLLQAEDLK